MSMNNIQEKCIDELVQNKEFSTIETLEIPPVISLLNNVKTDSVDKLIDTVIDTAKNTLDNITNSSNVTITNESEPLQIPLLNFLIETVKTDYVDTTKETLDNIISSSNVTVTNTKTTSTIPNTTNNILNNLNEMKNYVKSTIGSSGKITLLNVILILNNLMQVVEQYNTLSGSQKKMLVLDTLKSIINEQFGNTPEELLEKHMMFMLIDNTIPHLIDTLVSSINGEIKFTKNNESKTLSLLRKLFCCTK